MAAYLPLRERVPVLRGRSRECEALDRLVEAVRTGASRVLVVGGEPGVGKTALLDYLAGHAPGCRVVRAAGVQTEMEFAFAGLHQLCAPMLDQLGRPPVPAAGGAADRVRAERGRGAEPVFHRLGGAGPAVGGGGRAAAGVRGG